MDVAELKFLFGGEEKLEQPPVHVGDALPGWVTLTVKLNQVPGEDNSILTETMSLIACVLYLCYNNKTQEISHSRDVHVRILM